MSAGGFNGPLSCIEAEESMMLRLHGELEEQHFPALDRHLATCENCRREQASLRALEETLALSPTREVSAELLSRTRLQLHQALDSEAGRRRWFRLSFPLSFDALRAAPLAAAGLLLVGVGVGGFSGYQLAQKTRSTSPPTETRQLVTPAS